MPVTTAYPSSRVARGVAIKSTHEVLGAAGTRFLPQRLALFGQGNAASTYAATKKQVFTSYEVGSLYGFGSPLHLMSKSIFPYVGSIPVTVYPLDVTSAAAGGTITPDGSVTGSPETYQVVINNIKSDRFIVSSTDTVATMCTAITAAINAISDMPVIATDDTTSVGIDAKWHGTSGNNLYIEIISPLNPSITLTPVQPTGGTGTPDITAALAQIGNIWETIIVNALDYTDSDELDEYSVFGETRQESETHKPLQVITGTNEATWATITAVTDARTADRTNVIIPSPGNDLPFRIAAAAAREIAMLANENPAHDYCLRSLSELTPGADSAQWTSAQRDAAVKAGCSTIEVRDGIVKLSDTVTCYHPTGEEPPGFRYVVDWAKRCTIINELDIEFNSSKWAGVPLIPDNQVSTNPAAKRPKDAVASLYRIIDVTSLDAILADPDFAKEASSASIGTTNPKRLDVKLVAMLAGNTNVISIDFASGFNYGS